MELEKLIHIMQQVANRKQTDGENYPSPYKTKSNPKKHAHNHPLVNRGD